MERSLELRQWAQEKYDLLRVLSSQAWLSSRNLTKSPLSIAISDLAWEEYNRGLDEVNERLGYLALRDPQLSDIFRCSAFHSLLYLARDD